MLYKLVVFLHVLFVFGYLLAHGVSAAVSFALKKERDIQRIRAMLDLSAASYPTMFLSLYAFFIFGIIAGFMGGWWKLGWIWVSILLLVVIVVLMMAFGGGLTAKRAKPQASATTSKANGSRPNPPKAMMRSSRFWRRRIPSCSQSSATADSPSSPG